MPLKTSQLHDAPNTFTAGLALYKNIARPIRSSYGKDFIAMGRLFHPLLFFSGPLHPP
jgi:hypothetical protein